MIEILMFEGLAQTTQRRLLRLGERLAAAFEAGLAGIAFTVLAHLDLHAALLAT
jgi:hypothetical protein